MYPLVLLHVVDLVTQVQRHLRKCVCHRCQERRGEESNGYTELLAKVQSQFEKHDMNESANAVISKTVEEKIKHGKFNLKELIKNLNNILNESDNCG